MQHAVVNDYDNFTIHIYDSGDDDCYGDGGDGDDGDDGDDDDDDDDDIDLRVVVGGSGRLP